MYRFTKQFADYCSRELSFEELQLPKYDSLAVCILDCVYSLRARYESSTVRTVENYLEKYAGSKDASTNDGVSDLLGHIQNSGGPLPFAVDVLDNQQKSGGVLKSEVCLKLALYLKYLGIETIEDFRSFAAPELLEVVVHSVKGIGDAGTHYLFMLAGDENRCKPDVHIHQCIKDACGEDISNDDCQTLFRETVEILKKDHPTLTMAKLDGIIWNKYRA